MMDARGSGRTTQMVLGLPKTGCVVFVHHKGLVPYVRDLVTLHHGVRVGEGVHVLVAPTVEDEERLMAGRPCDLPVFRDHFLIELRGQSGERVVTQHGSEPLVPRRDPSPRCACGRTSPGWCQAMLCGRRPVETEIKVQVSGDPKAVAAAVTRATLRRHATATHAGRRATFLADIGEERRAAIEAGAAEIIAEQIAVKPRAPAEVSLGAAPQILDLMEAGFTFTEARGLPDAERDLYAQLVRERARRRERELARRPRAVFA